MAGGGAAGARGPLSSAYRWIDSLSLVIGLVALFAYLRRWLDAGWSLVGVLYLGALLPVTYHFHFFHPWDRPMLVFWIAALWCVRDQAPRRLAALLLVSQFVKDDQLFVPLLYAATHLRPSERRSWVAPGLLLALVGAVYLFLNWWRPPENLFSWQLALENLGDLAELGLSHPTLLLLAAPLAAIVLGWTRPVRLPDQATPHRRFLLASVLLALLHLPVYFLASYFLEARTQVPVLLCLLPSALIALRQWTCEPAPIGA